MLAGCWHRVGTSLPAHWAESMPAVGPSAAPPGLSSRCRTQLPQGGNLLSCPYSAPQTQVKMASSLPHPPPSWASRGS